MNNTFLTKEGYDKLQQELDFLRKDRRQEVAARLREASDGEDLIENAEYADAKNEQAFVEGRIKELEILLATAKIINENSTVGLIQIGSKVTIREEGNDKKESFTIIGAAEANPSEGKISNESPLGHALLGHKKNDVVTVNAPDGDYNVTILKVA
ncbi:MAG: transcription elongation factor GreA [Anaerolineaceae bacterium]|nr:transcription elongation factor GreA [Anaerolineaceae bacterium]